MNYSDNSSFHQRDITVRDVDMTVHFWFWPPYDATSDEERFDGEIEIDSIWIDEFDVVSLFGDKAIKDVEDELWKMLETGSSLG